MGFAASRQTDSRTDEQIERQTGLLSKQVQ